MLPATMCAVFLCIFIWIVLMTAAIVCTTGHKNRCLAHNQNRFGTMGHSVLVIAAWFGPLPSYFKLWLLGIRNNPSIQFILICDTLPGPVPANLDVLCMNQAQFARYVQDKCKMTLRDNFAPYKACDLKPLFGKLFEERVYNYEFWAWSDIDVIYNNNLQDIIDRYGNYDVIGTGCCDRCSGPLCLLRASQSLVHAYQMIDQEMFASPKHMAIDEGHFTTVIKSMRIKSHLENKEADPPLLYRTGVLHTIDGVPLRNCALFHFGGGGGHGRDRLRKDNLVPSLNLIDETQPFVIDNLLNLRNHYGS